MIELLVLCIIAALISIYELMHDELMSRYISSLALRGAIIASSLLTKWEPQYVALLLFCSPSTIMMIVTEAVKVFKGGKHEIHGDISDSRRGVSSRTAYHPRDKATGESSSGGSSQKQDES